MIKRFKVLLVSSIILLGCLYSYDMPSALNKHMFLGSNKFDPSKIMNLYFIYAFPNIVFPFIVGTYIEFKTRNLSYYLCTLIFLGQLVFSFGLLCKLYPIMLFGRFIYGLGGESFGVIQSKRIYINFKNKEISISMACFNIFGKLGTIANFTITPFIADKVNSFVAAMLGTILALISTIICFFVDKNQSFKYIEDDTIESKGPFSIVLQNNYQDDQNSNYAKLTVAEIDFYSLEENKTQKYMDESKPETNLPNYFSYLENIESPKEGPTLDHKPVEGAPHYKANATILTPKINEIDTYHPVFYVFVAVIFFLSIIWASFYNISLLLFQEKYKISNTDSGILVASIEGISIFFILITSIFSDFLGYRLVMILLGMVLLMVSHVLIYNSIGTTFVPVVLLGISTPLISCYWSCIPSIISKSNLSSGLSIISCVSNFAYTVSPLLVSTIYRHTKSFNTIEMFLILISFISNILMIIIIFYDKIYNIGINK